MSTTRRSAFFPTSSVPRSSTCCTACAPPWVASARMSSGWGWRPGTSSPSRLRRIRSVNSAMRITSKTSLVLLSVPRAMGQPAVRSSGIGGLIPRFEY